MSNEPLLNRIIGGPAAGERLTASQIAKREDTLTIDGERYLSHPYALGRQINAPYILVYAWAPLTPSEVRQLVAGVVLADVTAPNTPTVHLGVRIPVRTVEALDLSAKLDGLTRSQAVRAAIETYVERVTGK